MNNISIFSKSTLKYSIICVISSALILINSTYNFTILRGFISLLIWFLNNVFAYSEDMSKTFIQTCIIFSLSAIFEFLFSILLIIVIPGDFENLFKNMYVVMFFSLSILIITYILIVVIKLLLKKTKLENNINKKITFYNRLVVCITAFLLLLTFKTAQSYDSVSYIANIILLIVLCIIVYIIFIQNKKIQEFNVKTDHFIQFVDKYESSIDLNREFKHEVMNYLVIARNSKKKDDMKKVIELTINKFATTGNNNYRNVSLLPSGLKGIIYYKVLELEILKVNIEMNISKNVEKYVRNLDVDTYKDIMQVVTILLDNVIDEMKTTKKEKIVSIDISENNEKIIFEIANSISHSIDLKKLNNRNYSTKGKNRGMGLYLVNKIIDKYPNVKLNQEISSNYFVSTLIINKQ